VYGADTTFQLGANKRPPDVAFVSAARIPADGEPAGIRPLAPDLAVEVLSPNDLHEIQAIAWMTFIARPAGRAGRLLDEVEMR
jgi:Uma2 family endonuclease